MAISDPLQFSSLPEELQCYIFEIAADASLDNAPGLMLVSRSAASWVKPRVFREAIVSSGSCFEASKYLLAKTLLAPKSQGLFHPYLKRLCIAWRSISLQDALKVIPKFELLVDLAFWIEIPAPDSLGPLGIQTHEQLAIKVSNTLDTLHWLQRLSFVYESMTRLELDVMSSPPAWCTRLKYLDLTYWHDPGEALPIPLLEHMESLTHLSLLLPIIFDRGEHEPALLSALEVRPSLQVMLILLRHAEEDTFQLIPDDIRIVYHRYRQRDSIRYWRTQDETNGKWTVAEEVIAKRKEEKIRSAFRRMSLN